MGFIYTRSLSIFLIYKQAICVFSAVEIIGFVEALVNPVVTIAFFMNHSEVALDNDINRIERLQMNRDRFIFNYWS
jgi:hypothetical protein